MGPSRLLRGGIGRGGFLSAMIGSLKNETRFTDTDFAFVRRTAFLA